jgi:hypothetical protein
MSVRDLLWGGIGGGANASGVPVVRKVSRWDEFVCAWRYSPWVGVSHHFREAEITYAPIIIVACKNILIQ